MNNLLDTDGENIALRTFLLHYQNPGVTIADMCNALRRSGFDGCWPSFVKADSKGHQTLTKAGAQIWIKHLISLELEGAKDEEPVVYGWHFKFNNGVTDFMTDPVKAENMRRHLEPDDVCTEVFTRPPAAPAQPDVQELVEAAKRVANILDYELINCGSWLVAEHAELRIQIAKWEAGK